MKSLLTIVGISLLASCDCFQRVSGFVVDQETGKPLTGVSVYNKNKEWNSTVTDSTGYYELTEISGGFRGKPIETIVKAEHYQIVSEPVSIERTDSLSR